MDRESIMDGTPAKKKPRLDLIHIDVKTTAKQGADLAAPGTFDAGNRKKDAFDELIGKIPQSEKAEANNDRKEFMSHARELGHTKVKPANEGYWKMDGIKTPLRHHQVMGAGWMKLVENAPKAWIGGVLGDQMGLGKTLTTLALIINTLPQTNERATLIVVPPNVAHQWKSEVKRHCERTEDDDEDAEGLTAQMFRPDDNPGNMPVKLLQQRPIVITGYTDVVTSWNTKKPNGELGGGSLHKASWFRVCLDESQAIKNPKTAASIACRELKRRHAWCLSGTPIMNGLEEFFPIFDFIKHPLAEPKAISELATCDGNKILREQLDAIMIRRTYATKLFGSRLVDLPATSHTVVEVKHGTLECQVYRFVRDRFKTWTDALQPSTNKHKARGVVFELITRLRQMASHPITIQYVLVDLLQKRDIKYLMQIIDSKLYSDCRDVALAVHLRKVVNKSIGPEGKKAKQAAKINTANTAAGLEEHISMPASNSPCGRCREVPSQPFITTCRHVYCEPCLNDMGHEWGSQGLDGCLCIVPGCGLLFESCEEFFPDLGHEGGYYSDDCSANTSSSTSSSGDSVSGDVLGTLTEALRKCRVVPDGDIEDWLDENGKIWDSAKVAETRTMMRAILQEKNVKVIVFTQWLPLVKVLRCLCKEERWESCAFTGGMSPNSKDQAVNKFSSDPSMRVMIATLKAAGVGLNLTAACRVINMDSWWNSATEQQAFSRVYRIGQTRETKMYEMVVKGTVEKRMMQIKKKKVKILDGVYKSTKTSILTLDDLTALLYDKDSDEENDEEDHNEVKEENGEEDDNGADAMAE